MHGIQFIPTNQRSNLPVSYAGSSDGVTDAQAALLLAGKAGTDGILDGVTARLVDHGVVLDTDAAGNYKMRRYSDYSGNPDDRYVVDATYGLLGHNGSPGGTMSALVANVSLGTPALAADDIVHAAITNPSANSTTGIHAAYTLTTTSDSVATGITAPSGRLPSLTGNASGIVGAVTVNGLDLNGDVAQWVGQANGTATVKATLAELPYGLGTVTSIIFPPKTNASGDTIAIGYHDLVVISGFTDPDYPQCLTIKGAEADQSAVVTFYGQDYDYKYIIGTATGDGTSAAQSNYAFRTVISAAIPAQNDAGETIKIGTSNALGLPYKMDHIAVLIAQLGTAHEGTYPTVTYDGTNLAGNTVKLSSALDGAKEVIVDFIRCDAPQTGFVTGNL